MPRSSLYSCAVVSCKAERTKSRGLVSPFYFHVLWRFQGLAVLSPYDAVYQATIKKEEITPNILACKSGFGIGNQRYNGTRCREKLKTKACFQKVDEWEYSNLIQKYCLQLNKQCVFFLRMWHFVEPSMPFFFLCMSLFLTPHVGGHQKTPSRAGVNGR